MKQLSILNLIQGKKELKCERFLKEMNEILPWELFIDAIGKFYKINNYGRKKKELKLMLKIYLLQQWYSLSDPGVEEAIYDRNSFQKFLELDLLNETVPDETTILKFRHLLEKYELPKKFFEIINEGLEDKGLIMKGGTSVDATIIKSPSSTKNKEGKRDPEMGSTRKGNNYYFGMKAHIGTDYRNGLVHTLKTTSANIHDRVEFYDLLHGEEKIILGDKGYYKEEDKRNFRKQEVFFGVLDKAKRGQKLSNKQNKRNYLLSKQRSFVEHPFQIIKCQWKYTKTRYKGLFKNTMQLFTLFGLSNIYRCRKKLLLLKQG